MSIAPQPKPKRNKSKSMLCRKKDLGPELAIRETKITQNPKGKATDNKLLSKVKRFKQEEKVINLSQNSNRPSSKIITKRMKNTSTESYFFILPWLRFSFSFKLNIHLVAQTNPLSLLSRNGCPSRRAQHRGRG